MFTQMYQIQRKCKFIACPKWIIMEVKGYTFSALHLLLHSVRPGKAAAVLFPILK